MKRVIVTGATGFIGRNCLPVLVARGFEVHAVSSRRLDDLAPGVNWYRVDLLQGDDVSALFSAVSPTHLLHLAWYAEHGRFWEADENRLWLAASTRLFRSFLTGGGRRILAAGTCAEYDWNHGCCSETRTPLNPTTLYGQCKARAHAALASLAVEFGANYAWGRIFYLYGAGEPPVRLIPSVIRALLRGETADCTLGTQLRDFLEVRDVAAALVAALDCDVSGPINIASGQPVALRDLVGLIARKIGHPDLVRLGAKPTPPNDPPMLVADVNRLWNEVAWQAKISLDEGLDEAIAWWRRLETGSSTCPG